MKYQISGFVFAELVMYVEEVRLEASTAPVFKLAEMAQLYMSRMQQFGVTTRTAFTFSCHGAQSKRRDIMLVFDEDIGAALSNHFTGSVEENCQEKSVATPAACTSEYGVGRLKH